MDCNRGFCKLHKNMSEDARKSFHVNESIVKIESWAISKSIEQIESKSVKVFLGDYYGR